MPRAHAGAGDPLALAKLARDLGPGPFAAVILFVSPEADSTALEAGLREAGIDQLVIVGVATHNSVESTARTAGNLGFDTWVAEDACFTFDKADYFGNARSAEDVHAMSLGNLQGEYATVVSTVQVLNAN